MGREGNFAYYRADGAELRFIPKGLCEFADHYTVGPMEWKDRY